MGCGVSGGDREPSDSRNSSERLSHRSQQRSSASGSGAARTQQPHYAPPKRQPDILCLDPNMPSSKRIIKETERVLQNPIPGIVAIPRQENPRHFDVTVDGPAGTCFEGGTFKLELFLPLEYPMVPPKAHFLTRIYHPNIDRVGRICLDILKDKWSPALQIDKLCLSIQLLLQSPNPDDPLDTRIAKHFKEDPAGAEATAKEWTTLWASGNVVELRE